MGAKGKVCIRYILMGEACHWRDWKPYLPLVSAKRREKIDRFLFDEDKMRALAAALFVRREACRKLHIANQELSFGVHAFGKPYLKNDPAYQFSVSHAGRGIAFAHSDRPIGVDIEKIAKPHDEIAEYYFADNERKYFHASPDKERAFYEIWTKKEAYLKMLGTGLSKELSSFDVTDGSLKAAFIARQVGGYWISVCMEGAADAYETVSFEPLDCEALLLEMDVWMRGVSTAFG